MKEIANGIEEIQKALESSEMLELSSDQQSVRRITEIKRKDNIDECTIYVVSTETVESEVIQFHKKMNFVLRNAYRQMQRMKRCEINSNNLAMCRMCRCQSTERADGSRSLPLLNSKIKAALKIA